LLEREGFAVVGEAADGQEAVRLADALDPDVSVLDLVMPLLNGLDASREVVRNRAESRIILLTMHAEEHQVVAALRAGVRGYVLKSQAAEDLVQAIKEVALGEIYLSPKVSRVFIEGYLARSEEPPEPLAPRERQVLQLIAEGNTSKEVAGLLGVSVKTAESYRTRIMEKLDIHETAGLVRYAIRRGLIQP
jgi:DNA-binding NarL/FixJ family response regulator